MSMNSVPEQTAVTPASLPRTGLAIASLVLGILAMCLSFLVVGGLLGMIGIVLGFVQLRRRGSPKAMAWWMANGRTMAAPRR